MRMFCSGLAGAGILTGLLLSLSCSLTGWKFTGSNVDSVLGRRTGAGLTGLRGPTRETKLFRGKTWETSASVVSVGVADEAATSSDGEQPPPVKSQFVDGAQTLPMRIQTDAIADPPSSSDTTNW